MKINTKIIILVLLLSKVVFVHAGMSTIMNKLSITDALPSGTSINVQNPDAIWEIVHSGAVHIDRNYRVKLRYGREGKTDIKEYWAGARGANSWILRIDYTIDYLDGSNPTPGALLLKYDGSALTNSILESVNSYTTTTTSEQASVTVIGVSAAQGTDPNLLATITSLGQVPNLPTDIVFELDMVNDQKILLEEPTVNSQFQFDAVSNISTIDLTWDYIAGAESYDIEWVYIEAEDNIFSSNSTNHLDLSDPNSPYYPFNYKDPIKINTTDQHYEIDKSYSAGLDNNNSILFFRYRGIGTFITNCGTEYTHTQLGQWHFEPTYTIEIKESDFDLANSALSEFTWLIKKNYAEGGKNKKVVTYYDETNRSRQSLTNLSTSNTTAIAETLYDHEGRPVVNILPVPLKANSLSFMAGLHTLAGGTPQMTNADFDMGAVSAPMLSELVSGAANYYSANSPMPGTPSSPTNYDINQSYIPQAGGYPYTQVVYKNDNTKRIDHQSGVGAGYDINSSRATQYYYGNTNANELQRLFGTNVGNPSHYKKNMVQDANGQLSVSYLDQEGRTIATALAGKVPTNVNSLTTPASTGQFITTDLAQNNYNDAQTNSYISTTSFLNTLAGQPVTFTYSINEGASTVVPICYDCNYKLTISITDPNGNSIATSAPGATYDATTGILTDFFGPGSHCGAVSGVINFGATFPTIGEYKVNKTLSIVEPDFATAAAAVASTMPSINYYQGLLSGEPQYDPKQCNLTCEDSCNGDPACIDYCNKYHTNSAIDKGLKLECEGLLTQMKTQVSPGGIYYDLWASSISPTGSNCSPANVLLSNEVNIAQACSTLVANHQFTYFNPDDPIDPHGVKIIDPANSNALTDAMHAIKNPHEFVAGWADILVQFHPEYCHYAMCQLSTSSRKYDDLMAMEPDWDKAVIDKYVNPVNNTVNTTLSIPANASTLDQDPVASNFNLNPALLLPPLPTNSSGGSGCGSTPSFAINDFKNELNHYFSLADHNTVTGNVTYSIAGNTITIASTDHISLWEYVDYNTTATAICNGQLYTFHTSDLYSGVSPSDHNAIAVRKWQLFRGFYKDLKEKYLNNVIGQLCCYYYNNTCGSNALNSPGAIVNGYLENNSSATASSCDYAVCKMPNFTAAVSAASTPTPATNTFAQTVAGPAEIAACERQRVANANNFMNKLYYVGLPPDITHLPPCSTSIQTLLGYTSTTPLPNPTVITGTTPPQPDFVTLPSGYSILPFNAMYQQIYNNYLAFNDNYCNDIVNNININNNSTLSFVPPVDNVTLSTNPYFNVLKNQIGLSCLIPASDCNTRVYYWVSQLQAKCTGLTSNDIAGIKTDFETLCDQYSNIFNDLVLSPDMVRKLRLANNSNILDIDSKLAQYGCSSVEDLVSDGPGGSPCYTSSTMVSVLNSINSQLSTGNFTNVDNTTHYVNVSAPSGCHFAFYDACGELVDPTLITGISQIMYNNLYPSGAAPNNSNLTFANVSVSATMSNYSSLTCIQHSTVTIATHEGPKGGTKDSTITVTSEPSYVQLYVFYTGCNIITTVCPPDPLTVWKNNCLQQLQALAAAAAAALYQDSLNRAINDYYAGYLKHCGPPAESFLCTYQINEYHYTLYYYDQAGNLVQTVPPAGVSFATITPPTVSSQQPAHSMKTIYTYNSLNQVIAQRTPDAGPTGGYTGGNDAAHAETDDRMTQFWYNRKGQLRFSQNAEQRTHGKYSFTCYDDLGRIVTVGELNDGTTGANGNVTATLTSAPPANMNYLDNLDEPLTTYTNACGSLTYTYYENYVTAPQSAQNALPISVSTTINHSRGRVLQVATQTDPNALPTAVTSYQYDIEGNVSDVSQYVAGYGAKLIHYDYDLLSGKVNQVSYQPTSDDAFYHKYDYDADNRITNAYTSHDGVIWEEDAEYFYYPHGPLARTEIGEDKLQGVDYHYTIQGWLKGVNMPGDLSSDPGQDGQGLGLNANIAADDHGFSLHYYDGDYTPAQTTATISTPVSTAFTGLSTGVLGSGLYNGNIAGMMVSLRPMLDQHAGDPFLATAYKYDQLNRIDQSQAYRYTGGAWQASNGEYNTSYSYDANGNIMNLNRFGATAQTAKLGYSYYSYPDPNNASRTLGIQNRLLTVDNAVTGTTVGTDISGSHSYTYDYNGNLVSDPAEGIDQIKWNVYGKITDIIPTAAALAIGKSSLHFDYDGAGNRVSKIVTAPTGDVSSTYYVRDASGNIMATYNSSYIDRLAFRSIGAKSVQYTLRTTTTTSEYPIYGSSRLGEYTSVRHQYDDITNHQSIAFNHLTIGTLDFRQINDNDDAVGSYNRVLRHKKYELDDHLGNVLVTLQDMKIGQATGTSNVADNYLAQVDGWSDYYPFGMVMPNRFQFSSSGYRFGFNGKEKDDEIKGTGNSLDFGARMYDSRIARWLSLDPYSSHYPSISSYSYALSNPLFFIDKAGKYVLDKDGNVVDFKIAKNGKVTFKTPVDAFTKKIVESMAILKTSRDALIKVKDNKEIGVQYLKYPEKIHTEDVNKQGFDIEGTTMPKEEYDLKMGPRDATFRAKMGKLAANMYTDQEEHSEKGTTTTTGKKNPQVFNRQVVLIDESSCQELANQNGNSLNYEIIKTATEESIHTQQKIVDMTIGRKYEDRVDEKDCKTQLPQLDKEYKDDKQKVDNNNGNK